MTTSKERTIVAIVNPICCGLDVHKESITACMLYNDGNGKEHSILQEFTTFTDDLMQLRDWLLTYDCPVVAMESTSVLASRSQYPRGVHKGYSCQCARYQERARSEDRYKGQRMACRIIASRTFTGKFHTPERSESMAGFNPDEKEVCQHALRFQKACAKAV